MYPWYKEPLFQFLFIGFFIYFTSQKYINNHNKIVITQKKINTLIYSWKQQEKKEPSKKELNELIDYYIQDEILYRESLNMHLDINEPKIKRLLIKKLKYISTDRINIDQISEENLYQYFIKHEKEFIIQKRHITFKQIYISSKYHNNIKDIAESIYHKIEMKNNNIISYGDKFYAGNNFGNISEQELLKIFNRSFVKQLFQLTEKKWSKPIESGFGLHIIYIEKKSKQKKIQFNEVKKQVRDQWLLEQNNNAYKKFYEKIRNKYEIILEK